MKKFKGLICVGVLGVMALFCCNSFGAITGFNTPERNDTTTNLTNVGSVLFYNAYSEWSDTEKFAGSSTANGGTTTVTAGLVNMQSYSGTTYISIYGTPTTSTGSVTYNFYGWNGSTTVSAANGTRGAYLLNNPVSFNFTNSLGTSTTINFTTKPTMMAVSVRVNAGSITSTVGLNNISAR